jgi:formate hydrogenlyase subunit 6/NADH:ubiquinone oxidoreductase subunit I
VIELVSDARCIKCDLCVKVCPTGVFEAVPDEAPVMCELYCPTDALFVAPEADTAVVVQEQLLSENGLLGSYRAAVGWGEGRSPGARQDQSFRLLTPERRPAAAAR